VSTQGQETALEALEELLDQLQAIGIYMPGCDEGQWAGTEGLSFAKAEAALRAAKRRAGDGGYRVVWEIDSDAATPEEAAREAWSTMRRSDSLATVFTVIDGLGAAVTIDLLEHEEPILGTTL